MAIRLSRPWCRYIHEVTTLINNNYPDLKIEKPDNLIDICSNHLVRARFLLCFKASEFGPKRLGNRSIVADTRCAINKFWINAFTIKGREWFRPTWLFVLEEDVNEYFNFKGRTPFMLFTAFCKGWVDKFPTIEQCYDHSARIQTVSKETMGYLRPYQNFKEKTGRVLCNTSFNGKNEKDNGRERHYQML